MSIKQETDDYLAWCNKQGLEPNNAVNLLAYKWFERNGVGIIERKKED